MNDLDKEIRLEILKDRRRKAEVRQLMFEKLKEMAEIEPNDYMDRSDYATVCSVMNDIAKTLLDK